MAGFPEVNLALEEGGGEGACRSNMGIILYSN